VAVAVHDDRIAVAREAEPVLVAPLPADLPAALRACRVIAHDYKELPRLTQLPLEDTLIPPI
jgi:hypothetical protein